MRHALAALLVLLTSCTPRGAGEPLPRLNIAPGSLTVSGLSAGGYMATQYQVAFSNEVAGAGVIAAGPWFCAQGLITRALDDCLEGSTGGPDDVMLAATLRASALAGVVDDPGGLAGDRVWIFHGASDDVVGAAVSDSLLRFYRNFVPPGQIRYETRIPAGHGFPTLDEGVACEAMEPPYLNNCDYDAAGEMLRFFYGELREPDAAIEGDLIRFGQARYVTGGRLASMADEGFLFVPKDCAAGATCRLHVTFHGCEQGVGFAGERFARLAGYNRWADDNRIVVLYPQVAKSLSWPLNPKGCWDWWGYSGANYAARSGAQLAAVRRMVEALGAPTVR